MQKRFKQGWYRLKNPSKFLKPLDEYMNSYVDGYVNFKSSLEEKAFKYQDMQSNIIQWSIEPFQIPYLKPSTGKIHRYYVDMVIITPDKKYLVEIKPKSQTAPPKPPKTQTLRSVKRYHSDLQTFKINQSKWDAQVQFQKEHGFEFIIFTENELN